MLPRPLSPPCQSVPSPFAVPALAGLLLTIRAVAGILVTLGARCHRSVYPASHRALVATSTTGRGTR
jgi:hypothetical protein